MGFLDQLSTAQKAMAAAAVLGGGYLLMKSSGAGGGSDGGFVGVVDMRRPTDDMNTPGASWGGDGYQYFAEVNQQNSDLLRRIWDSQKPTGPAVTTPDQPPVIRPPAGDPFSPIRVGRGDYIQTDGARLSSRRGSQDNFIVRGEDDVIVRGNVQRGVWNAGRELLGLNPIAAEDWRRARERELPPAPVRAPGTPGPPTPRPRPGEVVQ